jgi:hypothetical protein
MTRLTASELAAAHAEAAAAPPLTPEIRAKLAAILSCPIPDMTNGQTRPGPAAAAEYPARPLAETERSLVPHSSIAARPAG